MTKKGEYKRGRPKGKSTGDPRESQQRSIRVNQADWLRIAELAAREGETVSAYLRRRGLEEKK